MQHALISAAVALKIMAAMRPLKPGFPLNHSNKPALPANTLKPRADKGRVYLFHGRTRFIAG